MTRLERFGVYYALTAWKLSFGNSKFWNRTLLNTHFFLILKKISLLSFAKYVWTFQHKSLQQITSLPSFIKTWPWKITPSRKVPLIKNGNLECEGKIPILILFWHIRDIKCSFFSSPSPSTHIQLCWMKMAPLLNKPYWNEVTLRGDKIH